VIWQSENEQLSEYSDSGQNLRVTTDKSQPLGKIIGIRRGVSKGVEDSRSPPALWVGQPWNSHKAVSGVASPQGVEVSGMAGQGETLGSPWPPLAIRSCWKDPGDKSLSKVAQTLISQPQLSDHVWQCSVKIKFLVRVYEPKSGATMQMINPSRSVGQERDGPPQGEGRRGRKILKVLFKFGLRMHWSHTLATQAFNVRCPKG
jgi:hypothetical protein